MTNEFLLDQKVALSKRINPFFHRWRQSVSGWILFILTALTLMFFVFQIFAENAEKQIALTADLFQAAASLAVVIFGWRVVRHPAIDPASRKAWKILILAYAAYAFGHILWFYYSSILGIEPFPSIADAGFWLFYPLMLWALMRFSRVEADRSDRLKFLMDVSIVTLGGAIAIWHFVIRPTIEKSDGGNSLITFLNLSYVVGDLILFMGVATALLRRVSERNRVALLTIVFGLLNTFIADIGFAYLTMLGTYAAGHWIDNFFITGLLLFLAASHFQHQLLSQSELDETDRESETQVQKFSWLPYAAVAVSFGILLIETRPYWMDWLGIVVFSSLTMTALVVFRQIISVKENVRFQSERAAKISEIRFKSMVENSSDLITLRNLEGKVIFRSSSVKNILGYELDEIDGYSSFEMIHPEDAVSLNESIRLLETSEIKVFNREYRIKHKDGSWRVMEGIARNFTDTENQWNGIIINSRDITERRKDEEKLKIYTARLEQSNRELQDFAYVASHDLQEPLRKVQAFGDRLNRKYAENLGTEGADYIKRMRDAADRMQTLINDLLTFSRVTSKAQPFAPIDLTRIVKEVITDLEIKIEETQAVIEFGELPQIDADPLQMRQLFQNLIGNALKFKRADIAPNISIRTFKDEDLIHKTNTVNSFCEIAVQDNGIGFDEKYLDRIFTVFQRLHGRTEYEGSGVGLAVCRKIVERHGGKITAQSKTGEGATFIISLPVKQIQGGFLDE